MVNAGPDGQICRGDVFTTSNATASNASSTSWSRGTGDGTFDNSSLLVTVYTPGPNDIANGGVLLTLTANNINPPCGVGSVSDSFFLKIVPFPTTSAGSNASICSNGSYTVTGATATNYSTITWSSSGSGVFSDIHVLLPVYTPSATDISVGSVTLTLTATPNVPCGNPVSATMILTILPIADVYAGADASVCQAGSYTIMDAVAHHHDPATIAWSMNGTGTLTNGSSLQPTYAPSAADVAAGSVILTVTVSSLSPCVAPVTDFMVLTVIPTPVVSAGPDANVCAGASFPITVASAPTGSSVAWSKTTGTGTFSNQNILFPTYIPSAADLVAGHVTLRLTAQPVSPCNSAVYDEFVLTFVPPATANAGPDDRICQSQTTYTIGGTSSNSSSVNWTTSGTGTFVSGTTLTPTYSPSPADIAAGSVTLTLHATGTAPCADATDFMVLSFAHTPTVSAGSAASVCQGYPFTVSDATASDYSSLLWTHNGLGNWSSNPATTLTPTYNPGTGETGPVTLTLTANASTPCGGQVFATKILTIQAAPTAYAGPDAQVCQPNTYTIIGATAANAGILNWSSSGSGTFTGNGTLTPTYHPSSADFSSGQVTLTLQANGINSCSAPVTDNMVLQLISTPTAYAGIDAIICQGGSYAVSDAAVTKYSSFIWTKSGTGSLTGDNTLTPTTPSAADFVTGAVTLTLTVNQILLRCCG